MQPDSGASRLELDTTLHSLEVQETRSHVVGVSPEALVNASVNTTLGKELQSLAITCSRLEDVFIGEEDETEEAERHWEESTPSPQMMEMLSQANAEVRRYKEVSWELCNMKVSGILLVLSGNDEHETVSRSKLPVCISNDTFIPASISEPVC